MKALWVAFAICAAFFVAGTASNSQVVTPGAPSIGTAGVNVPNSTAAPSPTPTPSVAPVQYVNSSAFTSPTLTVTWSPAPVAGHLLYCVVTWNIAGTSGVPPSITESDTSGGSAAQTWTQTDSYGGTNYSAYTWAKIAGSSEPTTLTFTQGTTNGNYLTAFCEEYKNVASTLAAALPQHTMVPTPTTTAQAVAPGFTPTVLETQPVIYELTGSSTGGSVSTPLPTGYTQVMAATSNPISDRYIFRGALTTDTTTNIAPAFTLSAAPNHPGIIWQGMIYP
jgi:hypothetical protein